MSRLLARQPRATSEGGSTAAARRIANQAEFTTLQRECSSCQRGRTEDDDQLVWRQAADNLTPELVPPIVTEVNRSSGSPLEKSLRSRLEGAFGWNFAHVRIHADSQADAAARAVHARAYTAGSHVVFANGQFQPESTDGSRLLRHELAHVVQQQSGASFVSPGISRPGDAAEQDADRRAAAAALATGPRTAATPPALGKVEASAAAAAVQRSPGDGMAPPGDCDWSRYVALRAAVEGAKLVTSSLGACTPTDDCSILALKIAAIAAEIAARVALDATCFRGGDTGHRQQVQDKINMLNRCTRFFETGECPEKLAALVAAAAAAVALAEEAAAIAQAALTLLESLIAAGAALAGELTLLEILEGLLVLLFV